MERIRRTDDEALASLCYAYKIIPDTLLERVTVPQSILMAEAAARAEGNAEEDESQGTDPNAMPIAIDTGTLPAEARQKILKKLNLG